MGIGDSKLKEGGDIRVTLDISYASKITGKSEILVTYSSKTFVPSDLFMLGNFVNELSTGDVTRIFHINGTMKDEPYSKKDVKSTTHSERLMAFKALIADKKFMYSTIADSISIKNTSRTNAGDKLMDEIREMLSFLNICYGMCYIKNKEACHCHGHKRSYCNKTAERLVTEPVVVTTVVENVKETIVVPHSQVGVQFVTRTTKVGDEELIVFEGYDTRMMSLKTTEKNMLVIAPARLDPSKNITIALNRNMPAITDYGMFVLKYKDELNNELSKMKNETAIIVIALPFTKETDANNFALFALDRCAEHKIKLKTLVIVNVNQAPCVISDEEIQKGLENVKEKSGADSVALLIYTNDEIPDVE
jgi:hypothetical protein